MRRIILFFVYVIFTISCSSDSTTPREEVVESPKNEQLQVIYRQEVVSIDGFSGLIIGNNYNIVLGNKNITSYAISDNTISFVVPNDQSLGTNKLVISELKNFSKTFDVKVKTLDKSPDEVISPLYTSYDKLIRNAEPEDKLDIEKYTTQFKSYYASASEQEKKDFAVFYSLNQEYFNKTIDHKSGRLSNEQLAAHLTFMAVHFVGMGTSVVLLVGGGPLGQIAAIPFFLIHAKEFKKEWNKVKPEAYIEGWFNTGDDDFEGRISKVQSSLVFEAGKDREIKISRQKREISLKDNNEGRWGGLISYIENSNKIIDVVNGIIVTLNKLPLVNLNQIEKSEIANQSTFKNYPLTSDEFKYLNFNITSEDIQILKSQFVRDGVIKMNIDFKPTSKLSEYSGKLDYNYDNEDDNVKGEFGISVTKDIKFVGLSLGNRTKKSSGCDASMTNAYDIELIFNFTGNSTPIGGTIMVKTLWSPDKDGVYQGNIDGPFIPISINEHNSFNNQVKQVLGFCWQVAPPKFLYQYISPKGIKTEIFETVIN